ncbi:MAG: DUF2298 domain-containing protein [Chloroflexota bacterium]|nr:DUF2298 domain-containing protein [Chloroflexota bacterium]
MSDRAARRSMALRLLRRGARPPTPTWALHAVALVAVLAVGAALRFVGLDWDQGQHQHPDERFLSTVLLQIQPAPDLWTYFDPRRSPLNPFNHGISFFVYGTFPLYLLESLARALGRTGYDEAYLVGRALAALFDLGTVLLVYLLGRRVLGPWPGLMAATLMALAVHSVQIAHFFAVDTFATFFATLTLWLLVRYGRSRDARSLGLAGIAAGLAMASKLSTGLLLAFVAGWWALTWIREGSLRDTWTSRGVRVAHLAVFGAFAALTYRLFQPYAFAEAWPWDWRLGPAFTSALAQQQAIQSGRLDWPPGIQWAGTTAWRYPLEQIVRWGAGPAFGLAALVGLVLAAVDWWRQRKHVLALVLAWGGLNFLVFGAFVLKTMRYVHPVYPVLALVTAWAFSWSWRQRGRLHGLAGWVIAAALATVLGATALWALAFTQIHGREHSRVTASAFIYANAPPGSTIAVEHWDDALPLPLDGLHPDRFRRVQVRVYDPDREAKRTYLIEALNQADLVVLASDRGAATIPRMPQRYPLTARYYAALDDGSLGFDLLARFESRPSLGTWVIDDREAEEAFSVYDHPTVSIYGRRGDGTAAAIQRELGSVDLRGVMQVLPKDAVARRTDLTSTEAARVAEEAGWPAQFQERPLRGAGALLAWLAAVWVAGLLAWPLVWLALRRMPDRGYAAARVLGPTLLVVPAWWLASTGALRFDTPAILAGVGLVAVAAGIVVWRRGSELRSAIARSARPILLTETLTLLAFGAMLILRVRNPDLWHPVFGGEKPMDFAHLNAVIRSPVFPPHDPWYSGSRLNYYYLGHVPTAALAKTLGVVPATAYNLAVASAFAAAVAAVFGAASGLWSLLGRRWREAAGVGLAAVALVLLAGNLHVGLQLAVFAQQAAGDTGIAALEAPGLLLGGGLAEAFDFWAATRVIPRTVNEFPWFTFMYGDLHPHLLNFANTAAALIGTAAIVGLGEAARRRHATGWHSWAAVLAFQTFVLALHRVVNPWDYPTYAVVTLAAFGYALWRGGQLGPRAIVAALLGTLVGLTVVTQLLFQPFHASYVDFYGGLDPTPGTTPAAQWLLIFGLPLAVLATYAALRLLEQLRAEPSRAALLAAGIAAAALLLGLLGAGADWSTRALILGLLTLGATAAWRARHEPSVLAPLALLLAGVGLTAAPEVIVVRDDIGRLNTIFKSYLQAWTLLGLGAALAVPYLVRALRPRRGVRFVSARVAWAAGLALLAAAALSYPILATPHKLSLRIQPLPATLDGEAFMDGGRIYDQGVPVDLSADRRAIEWLRTQVEGAPVVAETPTTIYRWGGRVSVYTGLPTIMAWDWHAKQQHWGYVHEVEARFDDARELFSTRDVRRARALLSTFNVGLIYVGELERSIYAAESLAKFDRMQALGVREIYRDGDTVIYRVDPSSLSVPSG